MVCLCNYCQYPPFAQKAWSVRLNNLSPANPRTVGEQHFGVQKLDLDLRRPAKVHLLF